MKMVGEQHIDAPRGRVWEALNDSQTLRSSIPGCQSLDKETESRYAATVEVKVGPIGARFKGAVTLDDVDPLNGYTLRLEGSGGIAGSVQGTARVALRDDAGGTRIGYDVEARVGGRMAQLGGPLIDATAKQIALKFFARFGELVSPGVSAEAVGENTQGASEASHGAVSAAGRVADRANAFPTGWILAIVLAGLCGFVLGRGDARTSSDWAGLAIGLLVIVVAGAAFEYGRRSTALIVTLDRAALRRLIDGRNR